MKEVRISSKKETKKDSVIQGKKKTLEKVVDKSVIKETEIVTSDTKNFKGIFIAIAFSLLFLLIIYLIYKFKK